MREDDTDELTSAQRRGTRAKMISAIFFAPAISAQRHAPRDVNGQKNAARPINMP